MRQKHAIDLETARRIAAAAEFEALQHGLQVVIAIVDDGGHLLYLQRDGAQPGSVEVAIAKARSAALFRRPTRAFEEMVESGRQGYLAMPDVMPLEGGVPLVYQDDIVGAIGISGASSKDDGVVAQAGAAAIR